MAKNPRFLEDHELYEGIERSQAPIPYWLIVLVLIVIGVALVLSLPFWGDRTHNPGTFFNAANQRPGWDWGTVGVILYMGVGFGIIYWVTMKRG